MKVHQQSVCPLVNSILHQCQMSIEVILVKRVKVVFVQIIPQQVQTVQTIQIFMKKLIWGLLVLFKFSFE